MSSICRILVEKFAAQGPQIHFLTLLPVFRDIESLNHTETISAECFDFS
jgi:hypothetical protein